MPELEARERTCGDLHCISIEDQPFCQLRDGPLEETPELGSVLCQWSGSTCGPMACGADPDHDGVLSDCPEGSSCSAPPDETGHCVRDEPLVVDRTSCKRDEDCAPEPCCRPTQCVSRADEVCRTVYGCCACMMCLPCISACRCVDGCCVTEFDPDGCC